MLRGALGGVLGMGAVAGAAAFAPAASGAPAAGAGGPDLPDVPGMLGDRLANEFWYQFDETTYFRQTLELKDAYAAISAYVGGNHLSGVRRAWIRTGGEPGYPETYRAFLEPVREALGVVSRAQAEVFERYYAHRPDLVFRSMSHFAQGVLFDPRRAPVQSEVHTMNGDPPLAYHTWHAYQYGSVLLGVDRGFWSRMIPLNGFAWALQSTAKPNTREVNPPQPRSTVARIAGEWLPRGVPQVDAALLAFHEPD